MTFVGKVLVIVNLVLGICMMVFAGAVYHTQVSWKTKYEDANKQLTSTRTQATQAAQEAELAKNQLTQQVNDTQQRLTQAEGTIGTLEVQIAGLKTAKLAAEQEKEQYQARAQIATDQAEIRINQANTLTLLNNKLLAKQDQLVDEINNLNDRIYKQDRLIDAISEKYNLLTVQNQDYERLMRSKGLDPQEVVAEDQPLPPPPRVQGLVLNTRKETAKGVEYIEISIGSDDGLAEGHELFVTRREGRGKYLGKIRLVYITPDRAVGTVVEKATNGVIERGDNVSTEI